MNAARGLGGCSKRNVVVAARNIGSQQLSRLARMPAIGELLVRAAKVGRTLAKERRSRAAGIVAAETTSRISNHWHRCQSCGGG